MITNIPNFLIQAELPLSQKCQELGIQNFQDAIKFVLELPYRRNSSKEDLTLVFSEECGVCSTKHAALAQLAKENNCLDLSLIVGVYKMNEKNTPGVGKVLNNTNLEYIPEAHTYLVFEKNRIDITRAIEVEESPFESLLIEKEIQPNQIGEFKVELHQAFLQKWIIENKINYSFDEVWEIREACILALSC